MTKKTPIKNPSVFAFERKLDPSDALFYAGNWVQRDTADNWHAVSIREKSVRGTVSHRMKVESESDPLKQDLKLKSPNPHLIEVASRPSSADTLKVVFTLRVLGAGTPSACNDADYLKKLLDIVRCYDDTQSFGELSRRYAFNLANGRFLWRNRIGAENVEVRVTHLAAGEPKETWTFDALALPLRNFDAPADAASALDGLTRLIINGLAGQQHVLLQITAFARIGAGQEVFPSQEFIRNRQRGDKSKTLYHVNNIAGIHSQKIGNALRTIDTWHGVDDEMGPIAVEPYGSVTTQGKAYRQPKQQLDFYSLLDRWILKDQAPAVEQQHFVIATLVRGGVFGNKAG